MNNQEETQTAWTLWQLMTKLNELIWNRYENEFIEQYLKLEEEKYWQEQSDKDLFWETD